MLGHTKREVIKVKSFSVLRLCRHNLCLIPQQASLAKDEKQYDLVAWEIVKMHFCNSGLHMSRFQFAPQLSLSSPF